LASVIAIGVAPPLGFWVYSFGWTALCLEVAVLNLVMAAVAYAGIGGRDDAERVREAAPEPSGASKARSLGPSGVMLLSLGVGLVSFAYGSLTSFSALYADELGIEPKSLFLSAMAAAVLGSRLTIGRLVDRIGHRRILIPCFFAPPVGLLLLSLAGGPASFAAAAVVFGSGFGLLFPAHTAYVMGHVPASRRGAAFGAMLAAFDTGIGTGSSALGWVISRAGFRAAFAVAALLAALALPVFLVSERRLGLRTAVARH
jgi:predicted MFS family arabinose efflux permease